MDNNETINELAMPEGKARQSILVYLKIILLPTLVYLLFIIAYFECKNLNIMPHSIILMGIIFLVGLLFAKHSAEFSCYIFEQRKDEFKKELKTYILRNLLCIGKDKKSNSSFDDFIKGYTDNIRSDGYISIAYTLFPTLGILGTFISIAISMPNFNLSDTKHLQDTISSLLNGVGTAFYLCIYGILMGLWWAFFEKLGMNRFKNLINRQKKSTSMFFWTKEEKERCYMQESLGTFEKIGTVFDFVSKQKFFEELDKSVAKKFKIFSDMMNAEEETVRFSSAYIKETMDTLIKSQKHEKHIADIHAEILNVINNFNTNLKEMELSFSTQYNRLQSINEDEIVKLQRAINVLGNNIMNFELNLEKFSTEILEKQKEALDGFKIGMVDGMYAFKDVFEEESSKNYASLEIIKDLKNSMKEINSQANDMLEKLEAEPHEHK